MSHPANDWIRAQANRRTIPIDATPEQASARLRELATGGTMIFHDTTAKHPMNEALRRLGGFHAD